MKKCRLLIMLVLPAILLFSCKQKSPEITLIEPTLSIKAPASASLDENDFFYTDLLITSLGENEYPAASFCIDFDKEKLKFIGIENGVVTLENGDIPEFSVDADYANKIGQIHLLYVGEHCFSQSGLANTENTILRLKFSPKGNITEGTECQFSIADAVFAAKEEEKSLANSKQNLQTVSASTKLCEMESNRRLSDGKSTKQDDYKTDPVPYGKPLPVEPDNAETDNKKIHTCTFAIDCKTIFKNRDDLNPDKECVLPESGILLATQEVEFKEGESVFDVLKRICKDNKIHMEFSWTPIYNSAYVEGIGNLYEFDCGDLSGWMYRVNGWYPNYGCSRYQLAEGDVVEWRYTCDLGKDVGCDWMSE